MRTPLLVLVMISIMLGCASTARQSGTSGKDSLQTGLTKLEQALAQQQIPDLWDDVFITLRNARTDLKMALSYPGTATRATAAITTADAIEGWQTILIENALTGRDAATLGPSNGGPTGEDLAKNLKDAWGQLAVTSRILTEILFEIGEVHRAAIALEQGLDRFPSNFPLHDTARAWREIHPDPQSLVDLMGQKLMEASRPSPSFQAQCLLTQSEYLFRWALHHYTAGDLSGSAALFEKAAWTYRRSNTLTSILDRFEARRVEADAWNYAAWSHYYQATNDQTGDPDRVMSHLAEAERCFLNGFESIPDDETATLGLDYVGAYHLENLSMTSARDFYGRISPHAQNAKWWNNFGLFCRDTGTEAEQAGQNDLALALYKDSYRGYSLAIEIDPDDARMVNDTGLILLYHLHEDLDLAEELFLRAWDLGKDVCNNPFADKATIAWNFEAYCDAMLNLARLYEGQNRLHQAKQIVDELVGIAPFRPDARMTRASIQQALQEETGEG